MICPRASRTTLEDGSIGSTTAQNSSENTPSRTIPRSSRTTPLKIGRHALGPLPIGSLDGWAPAPAAGTLIGMTTFLDPADAMTPGAAPTQPRPPQAPRHGLLSPRSWAELLYTLVDLAPAIAFFALIVTLLSVGLGLAGVSRLF